MMERNAATWLTPKAAVRKSPISGKGLFATEALHPGDALITMRGRILTNAELEELMSSGARYDSVAVDEGQHLLLDKPGDAHYGNHSCDGNAWMRDAITTEARQHIAPDDEITIDYALFTATPAWSMSCTCGSLVCRGTVTGDDWSLPGVQARYRDHFTPFLNARIARLNSPEGD